MDSWLVSYDICDPKRLRKVATVCEGDTKSQEQSSPAVFRWQGSPFFWQRSNLARVETDSEQ